jgi:hypothetical protein
MTVLWDVVSCGLVETDNISRALTAFIIRAVVATEAVSTPETSVNIYNTTRHNIPKDIFILVAMRT